jgi:hybrid cluster-associated redox disulfide protein
LRPMDIDDLPIGRLMASWPQTLRVFIDWRLHCIGCPVAEFHTLADTAHEHGYELKDLRTAILCAIEGRPMPAVPARCHPQSAAGDADP